MTNDYPLSKHFRASEFWSPDIQGGTVITPLIVGLEALRDKVGKPIIITSGFRTPAHNSAVGGAPNSYHLRGMAADITVPGLTPSKIAAVAESIPVFKQGGIGLYDTHVHLDVRYDGPANWDFRSPSRSTISSPGFIVFVIASFILFDYILFG